MRLGILLNNLEWEEFDIVLHCRISPISSNQTFGIKDCILWIGSKLILCCISNETFTLSSESHIRWSDSVTLVIGNNFYSSISIYTNTERKDSLNKKFSSTISEKSIRIFLQVNWTYQEYVVPKSIPITVPTSSFSFLSSLAARASANRQVMPNNMCTFISTCGKYND